MTAESDHGYLIHPSKGAGEEEGSMERRAARPQNGRGNSVVDINGQLDADEVIVKSSVPYYATTLLLAMVLPGKLWPSLT
eukprot:SAG11_NODE_1941_length_4023_cov_5.909276_1_plen_80_part_00